MELDEIELWARPEVDGFSFKPHDYCLMPKSLCFPAFYKNTVTVTAKEFFPEEHFNRFADENKRTM